MIKIILPQNNSNLLNDLSDEILKDVCIRIYGTEDYVVEYENRRTGRYIKLIEDQINETHFICFSKPNNNSRNAHLMQFVSPTYVEYNRDQSTNKFLDIYLINQSSNDRTDYIKLFYKCFATIGINVMNLEGISKIIPFYSYEDLQIYRKKTSERNSRNRSTYFTDDDKCISIYGKTFGANAMESFIFGLTIRALVDRPVVFHPVVDNDSENLSVDQQLILTNSGVSYGDFIRLLPSGYAKATQDTSRNQTVFKYNLLQKFGDQECYLCGCNLEHMIIAAHIERVTDIDNNPGYMPDIKAQRSTDGDNGLWLCASHDKLFEYGMIYFEGSELCIRSFITNTEQLNFINKSIYEMRKVYYSEFDDSTFNINPEHYNAKTREYLLKHRERHAITLV
jgi:hypothetical protein